MGLAGLLLADTFGADILTPLNDSDTRFPLCPAHQIDLSRYEVLARQWSPPGPDLLGPIFAPRGNIKVDPPFLQVCSKILIKKFFFFTYFNFTFTYLYNNTFRN